MILVKIPLIFNNQNFQVTIKQITEKIESFYSLKDKNLYPAWQIYKETCVCDEKHVLVEPLGLLTFDGINMRTYVRNMNL